MREREHREHRQQGRNLGFSASVERESVQGISVSIILMRRERERERERERDEYEPASFGLAVKAASRVRHSAHTWYLARVMSFHTCETKYAS